MLAFNELIGLFFGASGLRFFVSLLFAGFVFIYLVSWIVLFGFNVINSLFITVSGYSS